MMKVVLFKCYVIVLFVVLLLVVCLQLQVENSVDFVVDFGYVSGEYGLGFFVGLLVGCIVVGEVWVQVKGKVIQQSCIDCYGVDGNQLIDLIYLKLGGQYGDYFVYVLQVYCVGDCQYVLMILQVVDFSDQDIVDLVVYFGL